MLVSAPLSVHSRGDRAAPTDHFYRVHGVESGMEGCFLNSNSRGTRALSGSHPSAAQEMMLGSLFAEKILRKLEVEQIDSDENLTYAERLLRVRAAFICAHLSLTPLECGSMACASRAAYLGNVELCLLVSIFFLLVHSLIHACSWVTDGFNMNTCVRMIASFLVRNCTRLNIV